MLIDRTEDAATPAIDIHRAIRGGTLRIVGLHTGDDVEVEIPKVANPDASEDGDWTPLVIDSTPLVLNAANNARAVVSTGLIRIKKPASVGNAYGVEYV